jgi:hypothetical protein
MVERVDCTRLGDKQVDLLGHASIKLTVDTCGKWLSKENKVAVDCLDDVVVGARR